MRLLYKTISYGIVHVIVATMVAYAITGDWAMALGIGIVEPIVQTGVFALHDYFWEAKKPQQTAGCHGLLAFWHPSTAPGPRLYLD